MVVLIKVGVAFVLPPEPVLHHDIHGDVLGAVTVGDGDDFIQRGITILRLNKTIGPARQHGRVTSQVTVLMNEVVHLGTVDDKVIDTIASHRIEGELEWKTIVYIRE